MIFFGRASVGRISEVHAYTAHVEMLTSQNVRLAGVVEGDTRPMSYQGRHQSDVLAPPKGEVEFVPLDVFATIAAPKRLVTSGLGGVFPAGLTIGQIIRVDLSSDGTLQDG